MVPRSTLWILRSVLGFRIDTKAVRQALRKFCHQSLIHKMRRRALQLAAAAAVNLVLHATFTTTVMAQLPTGADVVAGNAAISTSGPVMDVNAASARTIINWNQFNIGAGHTANFNLPDANSAILNRVTTPDMPSAINGALNSNGHVYLVNPSGIVVGSSGVVNTNAFVASTFDIANDKFMAGGALTFSDNGSNAAIVNSGTINTGDGGAHLIANNIANNGTITSVGGNITLSGGGSVTLSNGVNYVQPTLETLASGISPTAGLIQNTGTIRATGAATSGGEVYLVNPNGKILHDGTIAAQRETTAVAASSSASGPEAGTGGSLGGRVQLEADDITLTANSSIDASGTHGGGEVLVGGDWQGSGSMTQATSVTMEAGATIDASATESGDGGKIVLWSDVVNAQSVTRVFGTLLAKAGELAGNGGQIETSGATVDTDRISVNGGAANGVAGLWLIDPYNYTINSAAAGNIVAALNSGTSVTVQTTANTASYGSSGNSGDAGDITVASNIVTGAMSGDATLTLKAERHIVVNAANGIDATQNGNTHKLNVKLWADTDNSGDGINIFSSPTIATNGGSFTAGNGNTATIGGASVKVGGDIYINGTSAQTIDTAGGDITINGETIVANTNGITFDSGGGSIVFGGVLNSGNQYTYVDGPDGQANSWDWARNNAKNGTAGGSALGDSYMVTITSRLENAIAGIAAGYRGAWIGAYRNTATPNDWVWADGPEAGQHFFTQAGGGGSPESGWYSNFGSGEPNGTGTGGETRGQFFGTAGQWNDLGSATTFAASQASQYSVLGYVRETNLAPTAVTINAGAGNVTFNGGVGSSKALASLTATAGAGIHINGGQVRTEGVQTYNSPVLLGAHTNFSTVQSDIIFGSTIDSDSASHQWNLTATITPGKTYYWVDWISWNNTTKTATGTITVGSDVINVTYYNPQGINLAQTSGGTNYWTGYTGGAFAGASPYVSSNVANGPSTSDIIQLRYGGSQTLTFSQSVENLAFSVVSMNGNGYGFDQDFTIEGNSGINGAGPGYYGSGTFVKSIVGNTFQLNDGGVNGASVGGNSEPHGTIRFGNAFSSLTWNSLSNELWNGFTVGVSGTSSTAGSVQFNGLVGDTAGLGTMTVNGAAQTTADITGAASLSVSGLASLGGNITTSGNQSFGSAVTLGTDLSWTTTSNGSVSTSSTVDGAHDLTIETAGTGDVALSRAVGSTNALTGLTITTDQLSAAEIALAANAALNLTTSGASSITGVISGTDATLSKAGSGTLTLSGTNTYSGSTTVSAGTLSIASDANLGTAPGSATAGHLTLNGGTLLVTGNMTLNSKRGIELGDDDGSVSVNSGATAQYSGIIDGSGDFTKAGAGKLTLSGPNTYTGATQVSGGILEANNLSALGDNSAVTLDNTAGVSLNLLSDLTIGSLAGGGSTGGNVSLGTSRLTAGAVGTSTTFAGVISGTGSLDKTGSGDFTLTGNNNYTGATTIGAGQLIIENDAPTFATSSIDGPGSLTVRSASDSFSAPFNTSSAPFGINTGLGGLTLGKVGNTANITIGGAQVVNGNVSVYGGDIVVGGSITKTTTADTIVDLVASGSVTVNSGVNIGTSGSRTDLAIESYTNSNLNGVFTGNGSLTKSGGGFLKINTVQTYAGDTNINGGILMLGADDVLPDLTRMIIGVNGIFSLNSFDETIGSLEGDGIVENGSVVRDGIVLWLDAGNGASYDGTGNTWYDLSGNGYDGTIYGNPTYDGANRQFSFTSNSQYVQLTQLPANFLSTGDGVLDGLTVFSVADFGAVNFWERIVDFGNGAPDSNIILSRFGNTNGVNFELYNPTTTHKIDATGANALIPVGGGVRSYAALADGTNLLLFADGNLALSRADSALPNEVIRTNNFIGKSNWAVDDTLRGTIGVVLVYDRALTTTEVQQNHAAFAARSPATLMVGGNNLDTTFDGRIENGADTLNLVKNGIGTFTLGGNNSYSGTTTINTGTLIAGNGATSGTLGLGNVINSAELLFNRSDSISIANNISGSGNVTKQGTNDATLTGAQTYTGGTNIADGSLTFQNDLAPATSGFTGNGTVAIKPSGTSFSSAVNSLYNFASTLTGLTIGKSGNTADITIASTIDINGDVAILGGDIALDSVVSTSAGNSLTLAVSGNATQSASISTDQLLLQGTGNFALANVANSFDTIAGGSTTARLGNVDVVNSNVVTIGTVEGVSGLTASGTLNIATLAGDLTVAQNVDTTNASSAAVTLNAGRTAAVGSDLGGNLLFTGGTVTVGAGGRGTMYSGSIANSSGLTNLVGSGSGHFRYNSDEATNNFTLALGSGLFGIYREQPTIDVTVDSQSQTYGDTLPTLTYTTNGNTNGDTLAQIFDGGAIGVGGATSSSGNYIAGNHALNVIGADAEQLGYSLGTVTGNTLTVDAKVITTPLVIDNKTYDGTASATFTASANGAVSGDFVSIGGSATFADKNVGTGKTVNVTGLNITGADASNYLLNSTTDTSAADITAKSVTVSGLTADTKVYDGATTATIDHSTVSFGGMIAGDDLSASDTTGTFADKNVGTGKAVTLSGTTYSGTDVGNYTFVDQSSTTGSITPKSVTVSGLVANDRIYNGTTAATIDLSGVTFNGIISGDDLTANGTSGIFDDKNVGTTKAVTLSGTTYGGTDLSNYTFVDQTASAAAITAKSVTVSGITGVNKVYDGTTAATVDHSGVNFNGMIGGDDLTAADTAGDFADKNVANGKTVTLSGTTYGGTDVGNYTFADQSSTTADVTPKSLTVNGFVAADKVYDGTVQTSVDDSNLVYEGLISGDDVWVNSGSGAFTDKNVGTGKTVNVGYGAGGADYFNYTTTVDSVTTADITVKSLVINLQGEGSREYDGTSNITLNGITPTLNGLISGDAVSISTGSVTGFLDKNAGTNKEVVYSGFDITGADSTNYVLQSGSAASTATIAQKSVVISGLQANDRVYDGTTAATVDHSGVNFSGMITGDNLNIADTIGTFADKNVGTGKSVTLSGSTYGGVDVGNYSFTDQTISSADITPKALTLSGIAAANKTYDGGTSVVLNYSGVTFNGMVAGDDLTAGAVASFNDKNAGTGKTVQLTLTEAGADVNNYTWTRQQTTTADILQKSITISGITASDKIYDGSPVATVDLSGANFNGMVSGDDLTIADTIGTFADKNVGTTKVVTLSGNTYGGTDVGNYAFTDQTSTTADITAKNLTVSGITAEHKIYDGTTSANVDISGVNFGGLVTGDDFDVASTGLFSDKNVADGKTVALSNVFAGSDVSNYSITDQANTMADITPKSITISGVTAADKIYDGNTIASVDSTTVVFSGIVAGDDLTVSSSGLFENKNVGAGKTVQLTNVFGGIDLSNYTLTDQFTTTANVTQKSISVSGITASGKVYDGTTTATVDTSGINFNGIISGDSLSIMATGDFDNRNVANGKTVTLTSSYTGIDADNYAIVDQATTTANITAKNLTVSGITAENKIYDGTTSATVDISGVAFNGLVTGDDFDVLSTGLFSDKNVADGKTVTLANTFAGTDVDNYNITDQSTTTADISPKSITISGITAADKIYDGNNIATVDLSGLTFNGIVSGDNLNASGTTGSFSDKHAETGKAVTLANTTYGGSDVGNYSIVDQLSTIADITPKAITVSGLVAANKVYDGTTAAGVDFSGLVFNGQVAGDDLTAVATIGTFADKNVGTVRAVTLSGTTYGGSDLGNYSITDQTASTADITAKSLTVSGITADNKIYDGTISATVDISGVTFNGVVTGDDFDITSTGLFSDKNVADGKTVTLSNVFAGSDVNNYSITDQTTTTADITPKSITISGVTAADKIYDGNTIGSVDSTTVVFSGIVAGDDLTVSSSGLFDNKDVGAGKTVQLTNVFGGIDLSNYSITNQLSTTANVSRLGSVMWIGGLTGDWSDPANWAGGAIPDLANVANVIIPVGVTPVFDSNVNGPVDIDSLTGGNLLMDSGTLSVANNATLDDFTQNGGLFNVGGNFTFNHATVNSGMLNVTGNTTGGTFTQNGGTVGFGGDLDVATYEQTDGDTTIGGTFTFGTGTVSSGTLNVTGNTTGGTFTQNGGTVGFGGDLDVTTYEQTDGDTTIGGTFTFGTGTVSGGTLDVTGNTTGGTFTQIGGTVGFGGDLDVATYEQTDGDTTIGGTFTFGTGTVSGGTLNVTGNTTGGTFTQNGGTTGFGSDFEVADFTQTGGTQHTSGTFTVTNSFTQTGSGTIDVDGDVAITQQNGDLTVRNLTGHNVQLNSPNGGVQLGNVTSAGNTSVTAGNGGISQLPGTRVVINGNSTFNATRDNKPAEVDLSNANNDFQGTISGRGSKFTVTDIDGHVQFGAVVSDELTKLAQETTGNTVLDTNTRYDESQNSGARPLNTVERLGFSWLQRIASWFSRSPVENAVTPEQLTLTIGEVLIRSAHNGSDGPHEDPTRL